MTYAQLQPLLPQSISKKLNYKAEDRIAVAVKERFHQYALLCNYFKERPLSPQHTKRLIYLLTHYLNIIHQTYPEFSHKSLTCKSIYICASEGRGLLPFDLRLTSFYSAQLRGVSKQTYDLYTFLNSLIQDILPNWKEDESLVNFIYDIIGKQSVYMNISFEDYSNTLTTEEVLGHAYFDDLRQEVKGGACGCRKMEGGGKKKKVVARFETQRKELESELRRLQTRIEKDSAEAARIRQLLGEYVDEAPLPQQPTNKMAHALGVQPSEQHLMQTSMMQFPYYQQMLYPGMYPPNPYVGVPSEMSLLERQLYQHEKKNDLPVAAPPGFQQSSLEE